MENIETNRLIIRSLAADDLAAVHRILDLELGNTDFGTKGIHTQAERSRWLQWNILNNEQLAKLNQPPYGDRAIIQKSTEELVGICGFVPCLDPFEQLCDFEQAKESARSALATTEFGLFYAISPRFQKLGFGFEAAKEMAYYAFKHLHVNRVIATTTYDNTASIAVMLKLGMRLKKNPLSSPAWLQVVGVLDNPKQGTSLA